MSYNGSGVFNINTAGQPVVTGTVISSTAFNALTADLATGLTTALTKDGQTTPTANIPMGGFKVTGIAAATTLGDALSYGRAATVSTLTNSALTSGRVPYASTAGLLVDSANLTFNGTTLTAAGFSGPISGVVTSTSITDSGLTSGRVTFASTGGLLADNTNLFWDNTNNRLGIGTSSPTTIFQVNTGTPVITISSTGTTASSQDFTTNSAAGKTKIGVEQSTGGGLFVGSSAYAAVFGSVGASNTQFASNNNVRMTIDTSGNVGIGTASPGAKLHVNGGIYSGIASTTSGSLDMWSSSNDTQMGILNNGTELKIYSTYNVSAGYKPINFYTSDALKMTLDTSGNLLVGTTSAGARVYAVASGAQQAIRGDQSTAGAAAIYGTSSVNSGTGYVAYFTNTGSSTGLYISNTAAWQSTSDARLKTDVKDLDSTAKLLQLRPVDYLWKSQETSDEPTKRNLGFIAQEVKEVFPELVGVSPDGMFSIEYTGLIAPLVKAIQEQQAIIESLNARLTALESK